MFTALLEFFQPYYVFMSGLAVLLAAVQIVSAAVVAALTYAWFRAKAGALAAKAAASNVVKLDGDNGSKRLRVSLGSLFQWTVTANPDKGIAGGNIRLDFPIKSSLLLGACYLLLASVVRYLVWPIVPCIFLFFGLYHLSKWASALSSLRHLASLAVDDPAALARGPFTVRGALREARRVYRNAPVALVLTTFVTNAVTLGTLGLLAGPADAGMCAALHDALRDPDRRFPGYRFSAALSRPLTTALRFLLTLALLIASLPTIILPFAVGPMLLYASPICVLEQRGVFASIRESAALVARRPLANLGVFLIVTVPLALSALVGPAGVLIDALYLPFALVLVMAAFVAQRGSAAGGAVVVRVNGDDGEMREAA